MKLQNYALGAWVEGRGEGTALIDSTNGNHIATASSKGLDFADMIDYGRTVGGKELRKMTFQQRGRMLKKLALFLHAKRKLYYPISYMTGATKKDSWIDIEGGIGNLFANASLRKKFPDTPFYTEGDTISLSKQGSFIGHHILVPKQGVAIHINAFNFPIWGMLEKCAVNWLAGMPAIVKPATATSYLTKAMVKDIIESNILPTGSLQLICGSARGILDHADNQDVVTFTGSANTGRMLKNTQAIIDNSVPFNMEADSLNCSILGEDAVPGTKEFDIFIKEVTREMTTKCGQKCTAIRRVFVPKSLLDEVQNALSKSLEKTLIGDPRIESVIMGALASFEQVNEVKNQVNKLLTESELVYGSLENQILINGSNENGCYMSPLLLRQENPLNSALVHEVEAFGPVSTLMPYNDIEEVIHLANMGKGSLVSSIVTYNNNIATKYVMGAATYHGRILILNRDCSKESTGHGSPMPLLIHGGPGRAGGGEEMGGIRGVKHYMQRCAIQGSPTSISEITQQYQIGGKYKLDLGHPFTKHFEELEIGQTIITGKRTITEADIVNFANVSWDHFYAHTDITSLDETIFEERVAHGYFVLSAAAGLFVHPPKGPVLLNYGIEECRFTKPVYAGMTIGVRFTVKEKIAQEKRDDDDIPKGIVKFLVDIYDQENDTVAIATILTMVKRKEKLHDEL